MKTAIDELDHTLMWLEMQLVEQLDVSTECVLVGGVGAMCDGLMGGEPASAQDNLSIKATWACPNSSLIHFYLSKETTLLLLLLAALCMYVYLAGNYQRL